MSIVAFSIGGFFAIGMLVSGIVLTVVTMTRMRSGKIVLPTWAKVLLCTAVIAMLLIQIASLLPPDIIRLDDPIVSTDTHSTSPQGTEVPIAAP